MFIRALVQIEDWCRPGNKPVSEPMMVILLTHICVIWPQWVNQCLSIWQFINHICCRWNTHRKAGTYFNKIIEMMLCLYFVWFYKYDSTLFTKYLVSASNCFFFFEVIQSNLNKTILHFLNDMIITNAGWKHFELTNTSYAEIHGRAMDGLWWGFWWKLQFYTEIKL